MAIKPTFLPNFNDNIIAQAEFRHQRHVINTSRSPSGFIFIALLMLAPALIMSFILFFVGLLGYSLDPFIAPPDDLRRPLTNIGVVALITMNIALYLVVLLITLGLSSSSITRERESKNWEILLLTNVDAKQIVYGKWWASLQALWGDHVMIGLLRLGMVGGLIAFHNDRLSEVPFGLSPTVAHLLVLTAIMLAFTLIDAAFTTAIGVAIPLANWHGSVITAVVIGIRAFTVAAALWFANEIRLALINDGPYIAIALVGLAGFLAGTWAALRIAEVIAVRGYVSPSR